MLLLLLLLLFLLLLLLLLLLLVMMTRCWRAGGWLSAFVEATDSSFRGPSCVPYIEILLSPLFYVSESPS